MPDSANPSSFTNLLAMVRHCAETFADPSLDHTLLEETILAMGEFKPLDEIQAETLRKFREIVGTRGNEGQKGVLAQFSRDYEQQMRRVAQLPPDQLQLTDLEKPISEQRVFAPTDSAGRIIYIEHPLLASQVYSPSKDRRPYPVDYRGVTKFWDETLDGQEIRRFLYQDRLFTVEVAAGRTSMRPHNPPKRYRDRELYFGKLDTAALLLSALHEIGLVQGEIVWVEDIRFTNGTPLQIPPHASLRGFYLQFNGADELAPLSQEDDRLRENPELARRVYGNVIRTIEILRALGIEPNHWVTKLQYNIDTGEVDLRGSTLPILVDGRTLHNGLDNLGELVSSIPRPSGPYAYLPNLRFRSSARDGEEEQLEMIIRFLANCIGERTPTQTEFTLKAIGEFMKFASFTGEKLRDKVAANRTEAAQAIGRYIETAWEDLENPGTRRLALKSLKQFLTNILPNQIVREAPDEWLPYAERYAIAMRAMVRLSFYLLTNQDDPSIIDTAKKLFEDRAQDMVMNIAKEYAQRFGDDGIDLFMQRVLLLNVIQKEPGKSWSLAAQRLMSSAQEKIKSGEYPNAIQYWTTFLRRGGLGIIPGGGGRAPQTPPEGGPSPGPGGGGGGAPAPVPTPAASGRLVGRVPFLSLVESPVGIMNSGMRRVFEHSRDRRAGRRSIGSVDRFTHHTAQRMRLAARGVRPPIAARRLI